MLCDLCPHFWYIGWGSRGWGTGARRLLWGVGGGGERRWRGLCREQEGPLSGRGGTEFGGERGWGGGGGGRDSGEVCRVALVGGQGCVVLADGSCYLPRGELGVVLGRGVAAKGSLWCGEYIWPCLDELWSRGMSIVLARLLAYRGRRVSLYCGAGIEVKWLLEC